MAARKRTGPGGEAFWRQQLEMAEKRLETFEAEAQKVLVDLGERGRRARSDIQDLLRRAGETDLSARTEEIRARFEQGSTEVVRKLEQVQEKALAALGVAGRAQVDELRAKLQELSRKINAMSRRGARRPPGEPRRAG